MKTSAFLLSMILLLPMSTAQAGPVLVGVLEDTLGAEDVSACGPIPHTGVVQYRVAESERRRRKLRVPETIYVVIGCPRIRFAQDKPDRLRVCDVHRLTLSRRWKRWERKWGNAINANDSHMPRFWAKHLEPIGVDGDCVEQSSIDAPP